MSQLLKNLRKLGFKEFMRRWKRGVLELKPEQLLVTEITGYITTILAMLVACYLFFFVYERMWVIGFVILFTIVIQVAQLIGKYQTLTQIKKMKTEAFQEVPLEEFMEESNESQT